MCLPTVQTRECKDQFRESTSDRIGERQQQGVGVCVCASVCTYMQQVGSGFKLGLSGRTKFKPDCYTLRVREGLLVWDTHVAVILSSWNVTKAMSRRLSVTRLSSAPNSSVNFSSSSA